MTMTPFRPFAVALLLATPLTAGATTLGLDLNTGGTSATCGLCGAGTTYGWIFSLSDTILVDGLGVWDTDGDGLATTTQIGLWTGNGATLLQSVTVVNVGTPVASASANGLWQFQNFAPISLGPGTYLIGSVFGNSAPSAQVLAPFSTLPDVTLLDSVQGPFGGGLAAPTSSVGFSIFGPTFSVAAASSVPEPGSMLLLATGIVGLAGVQRAVRGRPSPSEGRR